jgi:hypothetical protein
MYNETMGCSSHKPPLLLERVGVRRIKSTSYTPLIPTFSLKGEGAGICVDTYAAGEGVSPKRDWVCSPVPNV